MRALRLLLRKEAGEDYYMCCGTRRGALVQIGLFFVVVLGLLGFRAEWHNAITISSDLSISSIAKERNKGSNSEFRKPRDDKIEVEKPRDDHVNETVNTSDTKVDSFRSEDLLLSKRVPCGANKCFFRLKSDPHVGYLVAPSKRKSDKELRSSAAWFQTLEASWQLAEYLEREYDIRQFLSEAPRNITITKDLAAYLNQNLWRESQAKFLTTERFPEGSTAFIQKVQTAPMPNLLFGCAPSKVRQFQRDVDTFLPHIKRKKSFARRFTKYLRQARKMLDKEPCLMKDFQVLMDVKGRLYHLDFDRCFMPGDAGTKRIITKEISEPCFAALDEIEKHIHRALFGK